MTSIKKKDDIDLGLVRELAGLLNESGLTEIEISGDDWSVRVARSAPTVIATPSAGAAASVPQAPAAEAPSDVFANHPGLLTSPMVGVVYTQPEPGAPDFVRIGDVVAVGDTVLLIEAMKVFNPIKAHRSGRVNRVFVTNGIPVEYGEPLLIID